MTSKTQTATVKDPTFCSCGCGEETKGGTWRVGHDAKHKSSLIARMRAGGEDAIEAGAEMVSLNWSTAPRIQERLQGYAAQRAAANARAEAMAATKAIKADAAEAKAKAKVERAEAKAAAKEAVAV